MIIQQLNEKLQTLDQNTEVIIEENHGEFYSVNEDQLDKKTKRIIIPKLLKKLEAKLNVIRAQ